MNTLCTDYQHRLPMAGGRHRRPEPVAVSLAHPDLHRPLGRPSGRHRRPEPPIAAQPALVALPVAAAPMRATVRPVTGRPKAAPSGRRQGRHRPAVPAVTAGIAIVGVGALVGAMTTPPPRSIELTAAVQSTVTDPMPTPLLAALTESRSALTQFGCADATTCPDNILAIALGALVNFAAVGADGGLLAWDNIVNLGADVVAGIALTPAALGVALSTGLSTAVLNLLGLLGPLAGPITTPLLDGVATVVGDVSAFLNIGIGGLGDAVAWKAQLDAVLADLVATGGAALVNGLTGGLLGLIGVVPAGLPDIDFADAAAALGAVINHVAVGVDGLLVGWDTAVNLGADIVGTIAQTVSATGAAITGTITNAVLNGIAALANLTGPIAAPVFTAVSNLVTGVSGLITTAITIPGAAIAWKAQLDAVLADLVATGGVALTNNLTGNLMGLVGTEPVGLPDIGSTEVCAAINAVVDHVTVGLADVFTGAAASDPAFPEPAATERLPRRDRIAPQQDSTRLAAVDSSASIEDPAPVDVSAEKKPPLSDRGGKTAHSSRTSGSKASAGHAGRHHRG